MRLRSLVLALLLFAVICLPAAATTLSGNGLELELPDEYLIITPDNVSDNSSAAKTLGFTDKTLKTHMEDNGMIFLALLGNNTKQIQLRELVADPDSFAAKIEDLSLLNNENIRESAAVLMEQISLSAESDWEVVANTSGLKAIKITVPGEETVSIQYVTVRNGKIYSLVGYDAPGSEMEFLADVFETMVIEKKRSGFSVTGASQIITTVIVVLLVAVAVVVIIRLIASFVIDFRNRDNDVREFVKIKRRKF